MPRFHSSRWLLTAALLVSCADPRAEDGRDVRPGRDAGSSRDAGAVSDGGQVACEPNTAAECACDAERSGHKTCNDQGTGYGPCECATSCEDAQQSVRGTLQTNKGNVEFTGGVLVPDLRHARDVDPMDGGCIARFAFDLTLKGGGCKLSVRFDTVDGMIGGLTNIRFEADSFCPNFPNMNEGVYVSTQSYGPYWFTGLGKANDPGAEAWCFPNATIGMPTKDIVLRRTTDNAALTINLKDLVFSGSIHSLGDATLDCVTVRCGAGGAKDDGNGWCSTTCAQGFHDNGAGVCVTSGCAPGYHDNGAGVCVTSGCVSGYHDGGDGSCVQNGKCALSYVINSQGQCVRCLTTSQCNANEVCQSGKCVQAAGQCTSCSPACASGSTCRQWTSGTGACATSLSCPTGYASQCEFNVFCVNTLSFCQCVKTACLRSCTVDQDCPSGALCKSSVCEPTNGCP